MAATPERYEQNKKLLYHRTLEKEVELARVEREAIVNFSGYLDKQEAALGRLRIGHQFGRCVLVPIHNQHTDSQVRRNTRWNLSVSPPPKMRTTGEMLGWNGSEIGNRLIAAAKTQA